MWNDLSMAQRGELMKVFMQNGIYDLNTMKKEYDSMHQSGDEVTLPNYSQNVFAEGGNIDDNPDDIDNRTGKPRYRRPIHNVNITSSSENNIEGAARDTNTIGPLAFYPPKYYIGKQGNQFEENPNVTYDSWFDEHPEMIDVMTDIVGRYNNRLNNRGQQLPQLNRFYFEKLYNPEDDPIIHEAIDRMLQAKWNRDVRTYNDNRTLNLWDTVEKFPAANMRVDNEYQRGGKLTFQQWKSQMQSKYPDLEMDNNTAGYDYGTYFKENYDDAVRMLDDWGSGVHFTDRYKLVNHPTFSDESMYSRGPNTGGAWSYDLLHTGEDIVPREKFNPSVINKQQHPELYTNGGSLGHITPYGQWQYPHQITTIPSNNITMQGVDYPVIGVSDTGDAKVMLPGLDYLYDGNYVTEYPV